MVVEFYNGRWIDAEVLAGEMTSYRYSSWRPLRRDRWGRWAFFPRHQVWPEIEPSDFLASAGDR